MMQQDDGMMFYLSAEQMLMLRRGTESVLRDTSYMSAIDALEDYERAYQIAKQAAVLGICIARHGQAQDGDGWNWVHDLEDQGQLETFVATVETRCQDAIEAMVEAMENGWDKAELESLAPLQREVAFYGWPVTLALRGRPIDDIFPPEAELVFAVGVARKQG